MIAALGATDRSAVAAAVVWLVNRQRTSRGLPALRVDARLDRSAQRWSDAMVADDDFSHGHGLRGADHCVGFNWSAVAEHIATGYATPDAVVGAWMASTDHFGLPIGSRAPSRNLGPADGCPYTT